MSIAAPLAQPSSVRAAAFSDGAAPLLFALAVFALCAFSPAVLNDGDTWSHVATGDWILGHRAIPRVDPFSFSFAGAPWTAHEWLSEVLFALAHRLAGWSGVVLLTGAAAGAAALVVARRAARELTGLALVALMALSLGLMSGGLLARPHVLALPVMALWADQLFAARERDRAPPVAMAALMALWANLHGGFAFGLALIGPFALEALWLAPSERRVSVFTDWGLFGFASLAAALITPFGIEGLLFPLKLMNLSYLAQIKEWQPENFAHPGPLEFALLALIGLALTKPLRLAPMRLLLLLGLIHMSLQHMRHEMLLAMLAPMLLARPIAEALGTRASSSPVGRGVAFAAVALAALTGARLAAPIVRGDSATAPISALAAVPEALRERAVLNNYAFGGYLIYADLRPFIDGRADMFGDGFLSEYARILAGEPHAVDEALKRWDIAWTIFAPGQRAVAQMDHESGWRRLYADAFAVVHVRD